MIASEEWMNSYIENEMNLISPVDLNKYFESEELNGNKINVINIGKCDLPTGEIVVCDPLVELEERTCPAFCTTVEPGTYNVEIAVVEDAEEEDFFHYIATRMILTDKRPVKFVEALTGEEDLTGKTPDSYFGFGVESGLACFADKQSQEEFHKFSHDFYEDINNKNIFDGFFNPQLIESYKNHPEFQSDDGDYAIIPMPYSENRIAVFSAGYGEGVYPVYFGIDKNNQISQLVIHFIDIEEDFAEEE